MDKVTENCEKEDSLMMVGSSTPMAIKLKIPKEGKRVCLVCKKEFSLGNAFAGHMRVHVMYHKNGPYKTGSKLFKKIGDNQDLSGGANGVINKPYLSSVNDEGLPTCFQCGKSFPSMKSFFGHMRCHPDRFWRGIIPPPNAVLAQGNPQVVGSKSSSLSCNSNVIDDYGGGHVVDLTKYLKGWSVTEGRGRRSLKMDDTDEDLLEAAEGIVMQVEDHESKEVQMELDDHESDSRNSDEKQLVITYKCNKQLNEKRKRMKLMNELELESGSDEFKFKCTTCNKCFSSHQALGGHRSSHNKAAKKIISDDHFVGENVAKEVEFAGDVISISNSTVSQVHKCKICDKVFPTGQALAASTQTESGRIVPDFDLNEVPAIMMEDEGGDANANVNGNGYASSSYNSNMGCSTIC
uniref:C2H2-type domain-containing protein n=1 Tax=Tanacetum cinerariifolium TaxID=118510 RepID=A0A6L2P8I4_TANCI|nr:hypothetical protein [Tanacetum cinerariifolium]